MCILLFMIDENFAIEKFRKYLKSFSDFDVNAFNDVLPFIKVVELKRNQHFVEVGKTCTHFGFIISGLLRAFYLDDGNEEITCICTENEYATSTTSFITQTPSNIFITAIEDSTVLCISHSDLNKLYQKHPFWAKVGRILIEKEFVNADYRTRYHDRKSAEKKYLELLKDNPEISNRVPLHYIASFIGITPETLSRIRKKTSKRIS